MACDRDLSPLVPIFRSRCLVLACDEGDRSLEELVSRDLGIGGAHNVDPAEKCHDDPSSLFGRFFDCDIALSTLDLDDFGDGADVLLLEFVLSAARAAGLRNA